MNTDTARAVAFIAGRLVTGSPATSLLDHQAARRTLFSGDVSTNRVFLHDVDGDQLITGQASGDRTLWLLHQGTMRFLTLAPEQPGSWSGFDYATHHHFDLSVDEHGEVRLLDYQDGVWRTYQL